MSLVSDKAVRGGMKARRPGQQCVAIVVTGLALALGACSMQLSEDAPRQPTLRVADAALAAGAPEMALRVADLTLAKSPRNAPALIARGDALYAIGLRDMAQAAYNAALAIDPMATGAQIGLGRLLVRSNPREAEGVFLGVLSREPDNVIALNNLGVARDMQGRNLEAQQAYRRAMALSPLSTDVRVNLGTSLALSGNRQEADTLLHDIIDQQGTMRPWRNEVADALALTGDQPAARQVLASSGDPASSQSAPQDPGTRSGLAAETPAVLEGPIPPAAPLAAPLVAVRQQPEPQVQATTVVASIAVAAETPIKRANVEATPDVQLKPSVRPVAVAAVTPSNSAKPGLAPNVQPKPSGPSVAVAEVTPAKSADPVVATPDTVLAGLLNPLMAAPTEAVVPPSPVPTGSLIHAPFVQLGSLDSEQSARLEWRRLSREVSNRSNRKVSHLLEGHEPNVATATARGKVYWRLRAFGFASMAEANALCGTLRAAGLQCLTGLGL